MAKTKTLTRKTSTRILTASLGDDWAQQAEDLVTLHTDVARADIGHTEAVKTRLQAEQAERAALKVKTKAERALVRARARLGVNLT